MLDERESEDGQSKYPLIMGGELMTEEGVFELCYAEGEFQEVLFPVSADQKTRRL